MAIDEINLISEKSIRDNMINRTDVLDKIGDLLLLPNTEYATTEQVANYYEVDTDTINYHYNSFRDELTSDGVKVLNGIETKGFLVTEGASVTNCKGYFKVAGEKFSYNKNTLFPKRAILRIGMLLRDSEVAKEIRTRLLDIIHDTEKANPEIIKNVVTEIDEEKNLMFQRIEAEMNGNFDEVCVVNAKLFALKNKRIQELETDVKNITTNALTITESKSVINRIVRTIAIKKYNGMFGNAWKDFYSKLNYQLGINIKARGKTKGSYLNSLNESEILETEKIVRSWALNVGLDIEQLLKIS